MEPLNFSPFHPGVSCSNPFDSPFHLAAAESPMHQNLVNDSPYHVPSSTESPLHGPDESPMYIPTSAADCAVAATSKSGRATTSKNSQVNKGRSQRRKVQSRTVTSSTRKRTRCSRDENALNESCRSMNKAEEINSDNSAEDSEYDTSDMDESECSRKRRMFADQMDGLSKHFGKFKHRFYSDKLARLETRIENLRKGNCPQYLAQISREQEKHASKVNLANTVLRYKLGAASNEFKINEACLNEEAAETMRDFSADLKLKIMKHKQQLESISKMINGNSKSNVCHPENVLHCIHKIFNEMYPQPDYDRMSKVGGPFITYQLTESEIQEDLIKIKGQDSVKTRSESSSGNSRVKNNATRRRKHNRKRQDRTSSAEQTVLFNNLNIRTCVRLCVKQRGKKDFYGFASGVDKDGALIISSQQRKQGDSCETQRVVTIQQINCGEIFLKAA